MIIDNTIEETIVAKLQADNLVEKQNHKSSGKLSAGYLYAPLQWQVLKSIGVPQVEPDGYTLKKFARGRDCEEWLVKFMPGVVETQKLVTYRGCIGLVDAVVTTDGWKWRLAPKIPHEIKSVTNAKFKRIQTMKEADPSHRMQACFYAKALGVSHYAIDYIASDDYRVSTWIYDLSVFNEKVDEAITTFQEQIKLKTMPVFTPNEKWQADIKYNNYPEWSSLTEEEAMNKLKNEYPQSYLKLKGGE